MSNRTQENIAAVLLLVVFVAIGIMSLDYSPRARLMPLAISIVSTVLIIAQLIVQNSKANDVDLAIDTMELFGATGLKKEGRRKADEEAAKTLEKEVIKGTKESTAIGILLGLFAMIYVFGYVITIPVFITLYFRLFNKSPWLRSIITGIGATAVLYFFFSVLLQISLYPGLIGKMF
ncbi:tripartite tricarboxylate transporter TctB family protein [Candidatus Formimonas warabiya]|uniref:DUF1468 domain-containing protein n=1 Tax=Formimonas warabiya TaxID=1761012 RepID=A0A3G1KYA7_FORW1|nr:tripartite tricarboxylate transporter TctB family protein [Candidatus Formimonas warabiya]ATW27195.1 hypothetical protein DCMF_22760 [Candidatus Formimonas warabiya]